MSGLGYRDLSIHTHGLINPLQVPGRWYTDLESFLLLPKGFERHQRMMPLLVEFRSLPEQKKIKLLEIADEWACGSDKPFFSALLATDVEMQSAGRHLKARMILKRSDASRVWLRLHDPCIYQHLCWLLSPAQMVWLMGPVSAWTWRDPFSGCWMTHHRPSGVEPDMGGLSMQQWRKVEELEFLNRYLRQSHDDKASVAHSVCRQVLDGALEATSLGLTKFRDKHAYVEKRLLHGPHYIDSEGHKISLDLMERRKVSYFSAVKITARNGLQAPGWAETREVI